VGIFLPFCRISCSRVEIEKWVEIRYVFCKVASCNLFLYLIKKI
jgi:endogenous inhibitor of DNA gyrase (YacG/DUF329 family)